MLRLLTVEAAEHRETHCAAASSLCLVCVCARQIHIHMSALSINSEQNCQDSKRERRRESLCNPGRVRGAATLSARRCWRPGPACRLQCRTLASSWRQLWRQAQPPAILGGSAAQPPLRQGGAGGQGQLAACSAGLSRRRVDSFGSRLNGLQSRVGQQRSHPYGKAVLAARASSPPASRRVVVMFNNEWLRPVFFNLRVFIKE